MKPTRFAILLLLSAALLVGSIGCQTVRGVGRDVESAGEGIQRATR